MEYGNQAGVAGSSRYGVGGHHGFHRRRNGQFYNDPEGISETAKFELSEGVRVITDDDRIVEPGSGEMGKIATSGLVPLGYYKDERKSAATFRIVDGVRYAFPATTPTVEADAALPYGRGSACINTQARKCFQRR
ncbi:MAG: hypothetical protein CM15mP68_0270 [Pseudomonadota bacterium]|nr:MAG: hypothetical protein CM15mP68_0270 [Pseudomonadota bacterium]